MANPPLTSPQLTELHRHYESQLSQIVSNLNLRKWIVEKMVEKMISVDYAPDRFIEIAERLHTFITLPATDGLNPPKESQ